MSYTKNLTKQAADRIRNYSILNFLILTVIVLLMPYIKVWMTVALVLIYFAAYIFLITGFLNINNYSVRELLKQDVTGVKKGLRIVNFLILPIIQLLSFFGIAFFVKNIYINFIFILFQSYSTYLYQINLYSYFNNEIRTEIKTRYVYDLLTLSTTFFFTYFLTEARIYWGFDIKKIYIVIFLFVICLIILNSLRFRISFKKRMILLSIFITLVAVIALLFFLSLINQLQVVFFVVMIMYLYLTILKEFRSNRETSLNNIFEVLVICIISSVIVLISLH